MGVPTSSRMALPKFKSVALRISSRGHFGDMDDRDNLYHVEPIDGDNTEVKQVVITMT